MTRPPIVKQQTATLGRANKQPIERTSQRGRRKIGWADEREERAAEMMCAADQRLRIAGTGGRENYG